MSVKLCSLHWLPGYRYQVDAMTVPLSVRKVVTEMGSVHTDGFAVGEAANVFPVHLIIPKTRPAVRSAFLEKFFHGPWNTIMHKGLTSWLRDC